MKTNRTLQYSKMFLNPGEIVKSFSVEVDITAEDDEEIVDTEVFASILGDIGNETLVDNTFVNFTMNILEQAHYFGSSGFYGTVTVMCRYSKAKAIISFAFWAYIY